MEQYRVKVISAGIAMGKISVMRKRKVQIEKRYVEDVEAEISRYKAATREAIEQLQELSAKALLEMGEEGANIFGGHEILLCDNQYQNLVCELLQEEQVNAEYAVARATGEIVKQFESLDDEYIKARAGDVKDVSNRLLSILTNVQYDVAEQKIQENDEPSILMAEELMPADVLELKKGSLCGIITQNGNAHSHAAIIAKTLGIPAITQFDFSEEFHDKMCIVDGIDGILIIEPDENIIAEYKEKQIQQIEGQRSLQKLRGLKTMTKTGKQLKLYANVGDSTDVETAIQNDAEGIGLLRSEFLFMGKSNLPTEEEQFSAYKYAALSMKGKPVIIRTLDLGGDKQVPYLDLSETDIRGIQFCLKNKEVFKTQLKAIFRAAVFGNVAVLYPMISHMDEVNQIEVIVNEVVKELNAEGVDYVKPKQGIMIETPQAAHLSDILAQKTDFFSIGTNDLICYTLSCERQDEYLLKEESPEYEKVWELIKFSVENAHKAGIPIGICGELGAEAAWAKRFWELGVDSISMVPNRILSIRSILMELEDTLLL